MNLKRLVGLGLFVAISACSSSADISAAEAEVPKFHAALDAQDFVGIYEKSATDMKTSANQEQFVALLDAVHRKLGSVRSSDKQGWNVNYSTSGHFVTLTYNTVFAEGQATERFVYRLQDKIAVLAGYNINSAALILK